MNERRAVVGYEGVYEVSEDGRLFRVAGGVGAVVGRELKLGIDTKGYFCVNLCFQNQQRHRFVHRLVAEAFLENPENLPMINHKDSNRQNNHYSNLEWCTAKQNNLHAWKNGRRDEISKAVIGSHLVTGEQIEVSSTKEAGRNGFNQGNISSCCRGFRKTHKGYTWRYKVIRKSF